MLIYPKRKLIFVTNSVYPSTSANSIQVLENANASVELGYSTHVLATYITSELSNQNILTKYCVSEKIHLNLFKRGIYFKLRQFYGVFKYLFLVSSKDDIVITRNVYILLLSKLFKTKFIFEGHGGLTNREEIVLKLCKNNIQTITISKSLEKYYLQKQLIIRNKNVVASDGFCSKKFPIQKRTNCTIIKTIGYFGRVANDRGAEIIFELSKAFPFIKFIIGGEVDNSENLLQKFSQQKNIEILGWVKRNKIQNHMSRCDILLMPYQTKTLTRGSGKDTTKFMSPMKLFEYLSCDSLIISSNIPVLKEILNPSVCVFASPNEANDWVSKINYLINNMEKFNQYKLQSYKIAQSYTWCSRIKKIINSIYE